MMSNIPDGYEKLPGNSGDDARKALDLAVKNGFAEGDVLTVSDGFLIPQKGSTAGAFAAAPVELNLVAPHESDSDPEEGSFAAPVEIPQAEDDTEADKPKRSSRAKKEE